MWLLMDDFLRGGIERAKWLVRQIVGYRMMLGCDTDSDIEREVSIVES